MENRLSQTDIVSSMSAWNVRLEVVAEFIHRFPVLEACRWTYITV
jgi:hypothetical protein